MEDDLQKLRTTFKKMKDELEKKWKTTSKKMEDDLQKKWKTTSSTIKKSTLIGCDIIVNLSSEIILLLQVKEGD